MSPTSRSAEQTQAIAEYFQGDLELFEGFLGACMAQFPQDIVDGDKAMEHQDLKALRLTAHSLKSILLTLGYPALSATALALEHACAEGKQSEADSGWPALRAGLRDIVATSA